ncbi:MAG: DUF1987 domain-containing protein [Marinilabiliales bacterium]|nr:DUF1987 domain-containing protein [Marinilabiliales bacterium]
MYADSITLYWNGWRSSLPVSGKAVRIPTRNHLIFRLDLEYFNSSSAKFLFDIFAHLKDLSNDGVPVDIEWYYDEEDTDLREAGEDLALLCELPFKYCPKTQSGSR